MRFPFFILPASYTFSLCQVCHRECDRGIPLGSSFIVPIPPSLPISNPNPTRLNPKYATKEILKLSLIHYSFLALPVSYRFRQADHGWRSESTVAILQIATTVIQHAGNLTFSHSCCKLSFVSELLVSLGIMELQRSGERYVLKDVAQGEIQPVWDSFIV